MTTVRHPFVTIFAIFVCFVMASVGTAQQKTDSPVTVRTDSRSIAAGKELFETKCAECHDLGSASSKVGPGLKGILKNPTLPWSGKPATPQNVIEQIRHPYGQMPLFTFPEEDLLNLVAFLNTL